MPNKEPDRFEHLTDVARETLYLSKGLKLVKLSKSVCRFVMGLSWVIWCILAVFLPFEKMLTKTLLGLYTLLCLHVTMRVSLLQGAIQILEGSKNLTKKD